MNKPTKPETLLELAARLDSYHKVHELRMKDPLETKEMGQFEWFMGQHWPRISKAVRELREYVESSGHPAELKLLERLDRGE